MKFSIIIPVYNVAPYLEACLGSIVAAIEQVKVQGEGERWKVEVICVDDGSTDGSGEILADFEVKVRGEGEGARKGLIFKVVHQQNQGVSAARNAGLAVATGDWVMFVDGDDVVRPETLVWVAEAVKRHPEAEAVHFGLVEFAERGSPSWMGKMVFREHRDNGVVPRIFLDGGLWSKAYARRLVGSTRFKDFVRGEDCLFRAEVMARATSVVEIVAPCYGYRLREGSAIRSAMTTRKLGDELWLVELWRLWVNGNRTYDAYRWQRLAQELTEFYAERFFGAPRDARRAVWPKWRSALLAVRGTRQFPRVNRLMLALFGAMPWRWCAWLLFAVPQKLKRMGVHR